MKSVWKLRCRDAVERRNFIFIFIYYVIYFSLYNFTARGHYRNCILGTVLICRYMICCEKKKEINLWFYAMSLHSFKRNVLIHFHATFNGQVERNWDFHSILEFQPISVSNLPFSVSNVYISLVLILSSYWANVFLTFNVFVKFLTRFFAFLMFWFYTFGNFLLNFTYLLT